MDDPNKQYDEDSDRHYAELLNLYVDTNEWTRKKEVEVKIKFRKFKKKKKKFFFFVFSLFIMKNNV
jgi:hypothetical protein